MALRVGAGKACINPTPDMYPIPSSFADWGVEPLLQECPYDDMFCRAIAIDNGRETTVLMTWDTMGYPGPPTLLEELSEEFGIPKTNFMIAGTHNHSCAKDYHIGRRKLFFMKNIGWWSLPRGKRPCAVRWTPCGRQNTDSAKRTALSM